MDRIGTGVWKTKSFLPTRKRSYMRRGSAEGWFPSSKNMGTLKGKQGSMWRCASIIYNNNRGMKRLPRGLWNMQSDRCQILSTFSLLPASLLNILRVGQNLSHQDRIEYLMRRSKLPSLFKLIRKGREIQSILAYWLVKVDNISYSKTCQSWTPLSQPRGFSTYHGQASGMCSYS